MLRVFFFGETDLEGPWHVKMRIFVWNVLLRISKGPAKGPEGRPKVFRDTTLAVSIDEPSIDPPYSLIDAPYMGGVYKHYECEIIPGRRR